MKVRKFDLMVCLYILLGLCIYGFFLCFIDINGIKWPSSASADVETEEDEPHKPYIGECIVWDVSVGIIHQNYNAENMYEIILRGGDPAIELSLQLPESTFEQRVGSGVTAIKGPIYDLETFIQK